MHIENLLEKDYVRICLDFTTKYDYMIKIIEEAFHTQETDEAKKKASSFNLLKNSIKEDFFNGHNIKLKNISSCGYEGYGYTCEIECEKRIIILTIPIKSRIDVGNFHSAHEGRFYCGYKESQDSCCIKYIALNYTIEEVAEEIKKFLEN